MMVPNKLMESLKETGGFSWTPGNIDPTGYMVAIEGHEETYDAETFNAVDLVHYIASKLHLIKTGVFIGAWVSDGKVYLDLSESFSALSTAKQIGRKRHQLAIYDVHRAVEITL